MLFIFWVFSVMNEYDPVNSMMSLLNKIKKEENKERRVGKGP